MKKFGSWLAVGIVMLGLGDVFGAALTAARDTPRRTGEVVSLGVATNTRIFAGAMVALNSGGYAVAASDTASINVIGSAAETVDNRTNAEGAGDNGAKSIKVLRGVFRWVNGDTFTTASIGDLAFVEDDQTVQKAAAAAQDIIAGVILDVDSSGVWVDTYDIGAQGTSAPTTLAVGANATVGGTLGVTGNATIGASKVVVTAASGNTAIAGTLGVTGASTFAGAVTATNAVIKFTNLPTATNGLATGTLWSDSGTIKIK